VNEGSRISVYIHKHHTIVAVYKNMFCELALPPFQVNGCHTDKLAHNFISQVLSRSQLLVLRV